MSTPGGKVVLSITANQRAALREVAAGRTPRSSLYRATRTLIGQGWLAGSPYLPSITPLGRRLHALLERLAASEGHS